MPIGPMNPPPVALHPENRIGRLWRLRRKLAEQQTALNLREYLDRMGIAILASSGDEDVEQLSPSH
jgi:hypothetical protein